MMLSSSIRISDNQADDPLPLLNVEGVSGATQPAEECREVASARRR